MTPTAEEQLSFRDLVEKSIEARIFSDGSPFPTEWRMRDFNLIQNQEDVESMLEFLKELGYKEEFDLTWDLFYNNCAYKTSSIQTILENNHEPKKEDGL